MKILLNLILLYLCVSVLYSCQKHYNMAGKYTVIQQGKYPEIIPSTWYVTLNNDSTFDYYFRSGFYSENSAGNWSVDKKTDKIVLNSYIENMQNISIIVTETKNDKYVSSVFLFNNPLKSTAMTKWVLNINSKDYPMSKDTLLFDKRFPVDSFYIRGYNSVPDSVSIVPFPLHDTIRSETYFVKDINSNIYHINFHPFVNYDIFHYKPIQDSFKLKNNTILFNGVELRKKNNDTEHG